MGGTSDNEEYAPYFFLSYARTPRSDQRRDPNDGVKRFYKDLCHEILQRTSLPHGVPPGFMDIDLRTGVEWDRRLAKELATCKVFVPLYSRRYFRSVQCGKEWAAFDLRRRQHTEGKRSDPEVIIPAYWVPVPLYELPEMTRSIQFAHADLGPHYLDRGLYSLMQIGQSRDHYRRSVQGLATRIIEVAERVNLPAGEPCDYESIRSAFTGDPERRFQITVVAATSTTLPNGRDKQYYGKMAADWNPYHPHGVRPIAQVAADIVREMGFEPEIGSLHDQREDLLSRRAPSSPGLILLDPWAVADPRFEGLLRELDRADNPWIGLLIPWSRIDTQIADHAAHLREHLNAVLSAKIAQGRPATRNAVQGIASIEEFMATLRPVVQTLGSSYLRNVQTFPPKVPGTGRPRLWSSNDEPPQEEGMS
ncbi:TIR-like protein FxsC [Sphaerisporangium aureirubrum]|uniref:TIR-like protein FxsC n=1 Tax=Sphaerisporangium aureirubrum TaxID=1544736 RepID=A0ABW1NJK5_9ACTN